MRSHIAKATRRSCVIMISPMPRETWTDLSSARISRCVVTSSAVDGSSAIRIFGSRASAAAMPTRWRMPARQLERIALGHAGIADADLGEAPHSLVAPRGPAEPVATLVAQLLVDVPAAAQDRVEHRERVLEHEPELGPAQLAQRALRQLEQIAALVLDVTFGEDARRQQPDQRPGSHRLAAAGLAHDADRLAAREREIDAGHDRARLAADARVDREIRDGEERLAGHRARPRSERRSYSQSPSRLTVVAVATSTNAGARAATGFWKRRLRLSEIMRPQSAVPGPAPRPR